MPYFRADTQLIAPMIAKDCLRYDRDNLASIVTLFSVTTKQGKSVDIAVIAFGDDAERINRQDGINQWFEVKGHLNDHSPTMAGYQLPKLSISLTSITQIPKASASVMHCELIGRLTRDPEHISKTDSYDFLRFSLAVNRKTFNQANFFDVSVFKPNLIESYKESLGKGQGVFVSGQMSFFQKGADPSPHVSVKLEHLIMLEKQLELP